MTEATPATERIGAAWTRLPPNLHGVLWILVGTVFFSLKDMVVKFLGKSIHRRRWLFSAL